MFPRSLSYWSSAEARREGKAVLCNALAVWKESIEAENIDGQHKCMAGRDKAKFAER